jgi:formate hydrogenlyase subunit 3/multisubunit Na+/H+ antiporter MnhD subunit
VLKGVSMTLDQIESIAVIAAALCTILCTLKQFITFKTDPTPTPSEDSQPEGTWKSKYTIYFYLKHIKFYVLVIAFFILALINFATNNKAPTTLDVISISACVGVIIFMLTGCAYKYTIWKTLKAFDSNVEY